MSEPKTAEVKVVPSGWRTMESAPRDGTEFLAREDGGDLFRAAFHEEGYIMSFCGQPVVHTPDPTHWMPLPAAPGEEAASPPAETGEGEAVAWRYAHPNTPTDWRVTDHDIVKDWPNLIVQPLYTHPASDQSDTERMGAADERSAFEVWYCADAAQHGLTFMPAELLEMREGDGYGEHRVALNSKWEGWQSRAALAEKAADK